MPTKGFPIKPLKVIFLAREQKATEVKNIFYFPLLVLKGINFTTGHIFSFFPGDIFANGTELFGGFDQDWFSFLGLPVVPF